MRHDVEVDAQSVGNEPQQKDAEHPLKAGEHLACGKGNGQTAQAGKAALDNHDLHGAFAADHLGAVVFQSPADTRAQNEQGSRMKGKAVCALKSQHDACQDHQQNGRESSPGDDFLEDQQSDQGGGDDLKVAEQGHICRTGAGDAEHQEDRSRNIQHDHRNGIGQLFSGQGLFDRILAQHFPNPAADQKPQSRAQIQKRGHHGGRRVIKQQF